MKFKVYGWWTGSKIGISGDDCRDINISFIPEVKLDISKHNFAPDEYCPFRRKGTNIFILVGWLIFGITLDFRFGRDTGYWPGNDKP